MAMPAESNLKFGWMAESLTDLDKPTGCTASNPGTFGNPTLAGSGDSTYAQFDGSSDLILFTPSGSDIFNIGTSDFTVVTYLQVNTSTFSSCFWSAYSGVNTVGIGFYNASGPSANYVEIRDPGNPSFDAGSEQSFTVDQDFISAIKRTSGTLTAFMDDDATGGMVSGTMSQTDFGSGSIDEADVLYIGGNHAEGQLSNFGLYYVLGFDVAISDTDLTTASNWTKTNIRSLYFGSSITITNVNSGSNSWEDGSSGNVITGSGFV